MIDIDIIEREIIDLERRDTTFATVERLAWLYTVKDHLLQEKQSEPTGLFTGSEFCECCSNVPMDSLMNILSEHMEVIHMMYPREYSAIIERIKTL